MQNILSSESPLMHTANRIADLIILNLLTILCSLPDFHHSCVYDGAVRLCA